VAADITETSTAFAQQLVPGVWIDEEIWEYWFIGAHNYRQWLVIGRLP
jgi:hypothetical protein